MPQLVILGTRRDSHVSYVSRSLEEIDVSCSIVDYLEQTNVNFSVDQAGNHVLRVGDAICCPPFLIWNRLKLWTRGLEIGGDRRASIYESQEWSAFFATLKGVYAKTVLNPPESLVWLTKPLQQIVAAKAGFSVPPSTITNCKREAQKFLAVQGSLVLKSLSSGKVLPRPEENQIPYFVMTMAVNEGALEAAAEEEISCCPHFFQRRIEKSYEVRVVVVGRQMHAFRIDSQGRRLTEVDWRHGIKLLDFVPLSLSEDIQCRIHKFMELTGLFTGSLDLIVDLDGDWWFLECNEDGQWTWLDSLVDGAISKSFAREFKDRLSKQIVNSQETGLGGMVG